MKVKGSELVNGAAVSCKKMTTDVVSSAELDAELERARATLRGVEDNIKRVFGKDSTELGLQRYVVGRGVDWNSLTVKQ